MRLRRRGLASINSEIRDGIDALYAQAGDDAFIDTRLA